MVVYINRFNMGMHPPAVTGRLAVVWLSSEMIKNPLGLLSLLVGAE